MRKKFLVHLIIGIVLCSGFPQVGEAQTFNPSSPPPFISDSLQSEQSLLPDTIKLRYFYLSDITTYYDYTDTTLNNFFHHYDPVKRRAIDYLNLGNAGSAARNMQYEDKPYIGFDTGMNQYDVYNYKLADFRFFENNVPLTDVFFSPVGGQQNFVIRSDFARNFSDNTSLSLNYRRIRQAGFYTNQLTKITNFGASIRYKGLNDRLTGFVSMISNVNEEAHNGGISNKTELNDFLNRFNISTFIQDGQTRYQQKLYSLINYYQLNQPQESKVSLLLRYDIAIDRRYYKYTDATLDMTNDTLFYDQFLREKRGIRNYIRVNKIRNAFYAYAGDGDRLDIRGGLVYDRYSINETGIESGFNNAYIDFQGDVPITSSLAIQSEAKLGLLDGAGDFFAKGSLNIDVGRWIELNGGASFFRYTPNLIQRSLVINGLRQQFWKSDFTKPIGSTFFGSFSIPLLRLKGDVKQSLVTNALYYNRESLPTQFDGIFSATTLTLANEFRIGKVGMENYLLFQVFSENIYNLPTLFSKHNLHIQGYLFKRALFARLGTEVRLTPSYEGAAFNPVIGNFYQSEDGEVLDFYPMTDIYITGKIQQFRFFLRFENIVNLLENEVQFQTVNHPQFDYKFRFGVSWMLLN